jgi:hypothetical protein
MNGVATINRAVTLLSLTLQFLLELAALAGLGYWGYTTGNNSTTSIALAVAAPLIAATVWGIFGAPKARFHLNGISRLLFEAVFFGSAAVALAATGATRLAIVFAVIVAANIAILNAVDHG